MNRVPGIVKGIFVLLIVVGLGIAIGWLSGGTKKAPQESSQETQPVSEGRDARPADQQTMRPLAVETQQTAPGVPVTPQFVQPTTSPSVLTNWEEKLDDILASEAEESEKARQMAAILPTLPEEGQVEVAQHLANLVSDEDYSMISGFLTNSALPEMVLDVLVADSLNRPNATKLPLLLDVAKDTANPKASEAREILQLYLDEDYGEDWPQWQTKIQEWLVNNPD